MASLGSISAEFTANVSNFNKNIESATEQLKLFANQAAIVQKSLGSSIKDITRVSNKLPKSQETSNKRIENSITHLNGKVYNLRETYKQTGESWAKTGRVMSRSSEQSFANMMRSMLNFKTFAAKIIHYITFSIGVQLVMSIRKSFSQMIVDFRDYERAITNAITISGYLGVEFDSVNQRLQNLSKTMARKTIFSALEVAKAFYSIASAGIDIGNITEKELLPILNYAAATQSDLDTSTQAVLTTMKAFGMTLDDTSRIVDTFTGAITNSFFTMEKLQDFMRYVAPIAGTLGISLEETASAGMLLVNMGLKGSQAGQRLNMILTKLLKPTDKARKTLAELGLSAEDINPELYSLTEILWKLHAAGFGAAEASSLFRARTAASAAALVAGVGDIEKYNEELLLSKGVTETVADVQENTLYGSFKLLSNALQNVGLEIGESLAPILEKLSEIIGTELAPYILKIFNTIGKWLPTIFKLIKIFVTLKVTMFTISKILLIYNAIALIASIRTKQFALSTMFASKTALGSLIAGLYRSIKSFVVWIFGVEEASAAAWQLAAAITVATVGLAAVAAAAALGSLGFYKFMDSSEKVVTTTQKTGLAIKTLAGDNYEDLIYVVSSLTLANYEMVNSNKSAAKSFKEISTSIKDFGLKGVSQQIDSFVAKSSNADIIAKAIGLHDHRKDFEKLRNEVKFYLQVLKYDTSKNSIVYSDLFGKWKEKDVKEFFKKYFSFDASETITESSLVEKAIEVLTGKSKEVSAAEAEMWAYTLRLSTGESNLRMNIDRLNKALIEEEATYRDLEDAKKNNINDTEKLLELENRYNSALENRKSISLDVMVAIKDLISEVRGSSKLMDESVQVIEDYFKANRDLQSSSEDLKDAFADEKDAANALTEALALYGAGSSKVENAERNLYKASKRRADLEQEQVTNKAALKIAEAKWQYTQKYGLAAEKTYKQLKDMGYAEEEINNLLKEQNYSDTQIDEYKKSGDEALTVTMKLSNYQQKLITETYDLADARDKLANATANQVALQSAEVALMNVRDEYLKYTTEKIGLYLESLMKVYDIESKLYKLRNGETKQLEELFDKLAKQGLISDKMIEGYKEIKKAEGNVLKLNKPFADATNDLTDDQRNQVEQFIATKKGTAEYGKELSILQKMVANGIISQDDLDIIIAMNDAQDNLTDVTQAYKDVLGPLMNDLMSMDIVTPEIAKAWLEIADNTAEAANNNVDLTTQYEKLNDEMESLIGINTRLAESLIDEKGERMVDVFDELIQRLGITGGLAGSDAEQIAILNSFFGTAYDSLSDFSDEQLITIASMAEIAQAAGLWEDGMTGAALATDLGANSLQSIINYSGTALDKQQSLYQIQQDLATAIGGVDDAVSNLNKTFINMMALMANIDPLVASIRFSFAKLITDGDSLEDIFGELGRLGLKVGEDMTRAWQTKDWDAWASAIKSSPELLQELEDATSSVISPESMTGESWENWFIDLGNNAKAVFDAINRYSANINLESKWDGFSFQEFLNSLGDKKTEFLSKINEMSNASIDTISHWDNTDWNEFVTGIGTKIGTLQSIFDKPDSRLQLFVDLADNEEDIKAKLNEMLNKAIGRFGVDSIIGRAIQHFKDKIEEEQQPTLTVQTVIDDTNYQKDYKSIENQSFDDKSVKITSNASEQVAELGKINSYKLNNKSYTVTRIFRDIYPRSIFARDARGAIHGLQVGISKTKGPMVAMIGEAGAEAVIPLEGANKKYGKDILMEIIPKYFPEMTRQTGGIINDNSRKEEFNILGPVTVHGIANVDDMADEFKYRYRTSK